ncbi:MAG TPA: hypothetical protein VFK33_04800 [Bacillales bacterium]|nr:hypothetical protein [Bacillales bacterium]
MFRRIGFFMIGGAAVYQAQSVYPSGGSFSYILTHFILNPFDFLSVSLLFLIGFLMFSPFFSYFLQLVILLGKKKTRVSGMNILEFMMFATVVYTLMHWGIWLPLITCVFAFLYGWFSSDFRVEKEIQRIDDRG